MRKHKIYIVVLLSVFSLFIISCATYHMTTESLLKQLADTQNEKKINVLVVFPYFFFPGVVTGNSLTEVKVLDKNGNEGIIPVNRQTSVRITKKDGKRKTFYFDTLIIEDSTITGKNDHFIGVAIKPIKLNNIEKIELQRH
ncbi:MAG: hypothetical protein Q8L81_06580 [Bacteroidota bacterium]|nr:hypothetical protein [Bacteroidota bacterium]